MPSLCKNLAFLNLQKLFKILIKILDFFLRFVAFIPKKKLFVVNTDN